MTATLYLTSSRPANYPLRRAVAGALLTIALLVAAFAATTMVEAVVDLGGRPAAASETGTVDTSESSIVRTHVAESGDTLWSIADRYRGDVGRAAYIDALIDLNGGTGIQVAQAVRLP